MLRKLLVVDYAVASCNAVLFMECAIRSPVSAVTCVHSPSDIICFFELTILIGKVLSYTNVTEERNIVKETCGNDGKAVDTMR